MAASGSAPATAQDLTEMAMSALVEQVLPFRSGKYLEAYKTTAFSVFTE